MSEFRPVPRLGTLKLLKLLRESLSGNEVSADELLKYIGRLEQSEADLLERVLRFTKDFESGK